jgi:REP element-mobilizing transposase RayT
MEQSKQRSFYFFKPDYTKQHGGSLAIRKRRKRRPINPKQTLHITLKSHYAIGGRCLLKHRKTIVAVMKKASKLFNVKVYQYAVCGNHLHLLIKGPDRESLHNFFRVFAGHTAQIILKKFPIPQKRGGAHKSLYCKKNQRIFWSYLLFSRIVNWGRDFRTVSEYIMRNTLEAMNIIAYTPRIKTQFNAYKNNRNTS